MEEDFNVNKKIISLKKIAIKKWMNIRKKGEDIKKAESIFIRSFFETTRHWNVVFFRLQRG